MTTITILGILCLVGLVISMITALALVEVYEGLRQVRSTVGMLDAPQAVSLDKAMGKPAVDFGLPPKPVAYVLLFLSPKCGTCHTLAQTFHGDVPRGVRIWITATDQTTASRWASDYQLPSSTFTFDEDQDLANRIGVSSTPVAVVVHRGLIVRAITVPSRRVLDGLLDEVLLESRREMQS